MQQIDLELQRSQQELNDVEEQLSDDKALVAAESKLVSYKEQLEDAKKRQKSSEWELEDLQEKVKRIDSKLYSGTTKDTKELVNLEKEVKILKSKISTNEDALLGLMSQVEEIGAKAKTSGEEFERLKRERKEKQGSLEERRDAIKTELAKLKDSRDGLALRINTEALDIYERIRLTREQAVVKVERGRCQGCHITVSTSQWQKAKAGDLVQCNSCGRILHV